MITRLIWTIWTLMSSVPKKADKLNLSLSLSLIKSESKYKCFPINKMHLNISSAICWSCCASHDCDNLVNVLQNTLDTMWRLHCGTGVFCDFGVRVVSWTYCFCTIHNILLQRECIMTSVCNLYESYIMLNGSFEDFEFEVDFRYNII